MHLRFYGIIVLSSRGKQVEHTPFVRGNTPTMYWGTTPRPLKRVLFDTTGFLGAQNLTQEQRDSRQNLYDNRSKEQYCKAICEHITAVQ